LRTGDIVTAIDGVATAGLDIDTIIARLRGAPGTQVSLEVHRAGADEPDRIVVTRDLIQPRGVDVNIRTGADGLIAEENGLWPILDFDLGKPIPLAPIAEDEFRASGEDRWREEQNRCQSEIERHQNANESYLEEGVALLDLARNAQGLFAKQERREKRRLLNFVLSNCTWEDGEVIATFRQPFDMLAETATAAAHVRAGGR
jgi:hypothetical protein